MIRIFDRYTRPVASLAVSDFTALKQDLGKSTFESWLTETGFVISDIDYAIKRLRPQSHLVHR